MKRSMQGSSGVSELVRDSSDERQVFLDGRGVVWDMQEKDGEECPWSRVVAGAPRPFCP